MTKVMQDSARVPKLGLRWDTFLVVSVGYIAAHTLTNGFVLPLQKMLLPDVPVIFSVLYLPHGIRVLAIWLLGWRGALYLVPSAYLMWAISVFGNGIESALPLASIMAVYVAVTLSAYLSRRPQAPSFLSSWRGCVVAGAIASLCNGVVLSYLSQNGFNLYLMLGFSFGDIVGQMVLMLILIMIMRVSRELQRLKD